MATTATVGQGESSAKPEKVEKARVNVVMPVDVLESLDRDAERCKVDRSAAIVEAVRARLNGGMVAAPPPVVVDVPTAEQIADAVMARMGATRVSGGGVEDVRTDMQNVLKGLTAIYKRLEGTGLNGVVADGDERVADRGWTWKRLFFKNGVIGPVKEQP